MTMIILKIIVISSTVLNFGFSTTQCNSDQHIEFLCQEPNCRNTPSGEPEWVQFFNHNKGKVKIVGVSSNDYFVKNYKEQFSIINKHDVKLKPGAIAPNEHWKYRVNIHKTNNKVCDLNNENYNDLNIAQMSINTVKTSDVVDIEGNELDKNEKDKSNMDVMDVNIKQEALNIDIIKSEEKNISTGDDNISNSVLVNNEQNDLNEDIKQNNILNPISSKKLENDSSSECLIGSCEKETNVVEEEHEQFVSVNTDSSYQQTNNAAFNPQLSTNINKINNSIQNSTNIIDTQHVNTANSQVNNIEEINTTNSQTQKIDYGPQTIQHLSDIDKANNLIKNSTNNTETQSVNSATVQVNNAEEINTTNSQTQKIDFGPQTTQHLSDIDKANNLIESSTNNTKTQHINTASLQVNNAEEINTTNSQTQKIDHGPQTTQQSLDIDKANNLIKNSTNNTETQSVNSASIQVNNAEEINTTNTQTQKIDHGPQTTQQSLDIDKADDFIKKPTNNNSIKELKGVRQENSNSGLKQDITDTVNQQGNTNYKQTSLLEETNVIIKNKSDVSDNNVSNSDDDNFQNDYSDVSAINAINKPYVNNDNNASTMLNNDSSNGNITNSSSLEKIINETVIVSSTDYQSTDKVDEIELSNHKSIDQCTSENECSMDPKYGYDNIQYKPDNENLNKFESTSIVELFYHPDTCSGGKCHKLHKNIEQIIDSDLPISKNSDTTSHSKSSFEKDSNNIIKQITEESRVELSILDHFQNWISLPTLNSINFLLNIFNEYSSEYHDVYPDQNIENNKIVEDRKYMNHSELCFIIMAIVTLLFSLIYYKYQKGTYENHLLTLLSIKDQSLLIVEKELSLLKEQSSGNTISSIERNSEIETLNEHLTKSEDIISSQAIVIEKLEEEVNELTESGMEMHSLLSSALESNTKNTEKINILKVKLADSENLNTALTQSNFEKTTVLEKKNDAIKTLKTTIDEIRNKNISLVEDNSKISSQLEQILTKKKLKESKLLGEISNLQLELDKQAIALITAENEAIQSKDALQEMVTHKFNQTDANKLLSSIKLSTELKSANQMCGRYKQKLDESLKLNKQYLDHIDDLKNDIVKLENNLLKLEEEKEESVNKLIILTKFFKEQEQGYLKQLNEKTLLYDNKEGESSDLNERIKSLNQEIVNYKSEIQSLKKEIIDQEASFKIQVSAADKKASDYWISFRQAERKLKEMELETAQLRNKLTMVDKKLVNGAKSIDSSKDYEDELLDIPLPIISPDFTLLDFEPPPPIFSPSLLQHDPQMFPSSPLQHTSVDQRLPPLGALGHASSPPLPLSRRHNRSLSPNSPPPPQRSSVFRPLPQRYNYMNRQSSLGHSVESLDK